MTQWSQLWPIGHSHSFPYCLMGRLLCNWRPTSLQQGLLRGVITCCIPTHLHTGVTFIWLINRCLIISRPSMTTIQFYPISPVLNPLWVFPNSSLCFSFLNYLVQFEECASSMYISSASFVKCLMLWHLFEESHRGNALSNLFSWQQWRKCVI